MVCALAAQKANAEPYPPDVVISEQPAPSARGQPWTSRPLAFELHGALGGPYGSIGAAIEHSTSAGFALAAGGGVDLDPARPHWGAMARIRPLIVGHFASGAEGGLSIGRHSETEDCERDRCEHWRWDLAVWGHMALFAEYREESGLLARATFGASSLFNVADGECIGCPPGSTPALGVTTLPCIGIAVGWAPEL
jgi:hypothetical protein